MNVNDGGNSSRSETTDNGSTSDSPRGRFRYHRLRRASFISPITGERSKRTFTLQEASHRWSESSNANSSETTPLLRSQQRPSASALLYFQELWKHAWEFANSKTGRGIFKCTLAYFLGTLVTFVPALSGLIGRQQDSKHIVATVTVWFHPARTIGSMHLATILAILGFLYSSVIGFGSMGVSLAARHQEVLVIGQALVLLLFLGGGMGGIAWIKQRFGDPLVNVATALASLGCVTILVKEGSVQEGEFSVVRVTQILLMVLIGVLIATIVNVVVLPVTARSDLRKDIEKNTDLLGEMLISITRAFLSGREDDLQDDYFKNLQSEQQQAQSRMNVDLDEARNEYLLLGSEELYRVSTKLVDCLDRLSQDLGALRSAAFAQFALMESAPVNGVKQSVQPFPLKDKRRSWHDRNKDQMSGSLDAISEAGDEPIEDAASGQILSRLTTNTIDKAYAARSRRTSTASITAPLKTPADMFFAFINQLGPPTKSLVYTLKQILDELPFRETSVSNPKLTSWLLPKVEVALVGKFRTSLKYAVELYRSSRKDALSTLYASRSLSAAFMPTEETRGTTKSSGAFSGQRMAPTEAGTAGSSSTQPPVDRLTEEIIADIEEVSACCGHFSFSLLDFAEDVLVYLEALSELREALEAPKSSWKWLMFWRVSWLDHRPKAFTSSTASERDPDHGRSRNIPEPIRKADDFADLGKSSRPRPWTWRLYRNLRVLRRDDVKYAVKVGVGAVLYSLPAFVPSTRPLFQHWRGEWGLVSYMAVCCMTIGAANTTSINRFIGTTIGACLAIVAWILAADKGDANPFLLAFFGWLVAMGCYYLILAKGQGPMGRFILLTYNLGALYAYSLSVHDDDRDDDEGGIDPAIWDIVLHRLVAVVVGSIWAVFIVRFIWPISARRKLKDGLCILWLRMSLVWKRDPLAMFLLGEPRSSYMDIREEAELHSFLTYLDSLRSAAKSEFELRGPFPDEIVSRIIERTRRMLDAFHAMNVLITKNLQYTPGEAAVLRYTRDQRYALSARISHLFSVLASSFKLEYPINDALPSIENTRDQVLARLSEFRRVGEGRDQASEQDFELLYGYVLVTGQLAQDIEAVSAEIETLFGTLNEENLKLQ